MFSMTDYDKLQQIMEESPEKKELLTKLLESHKMTISTISHEIRNPLTLIYSTLQLIESQHPEVTTYKHWSGMRQDIEYMKLLLEELSAYNNGERLKLSAIESNTFFKTLALSFAASLIDTEIEFTSKIEPNLPMIQGDRLKLREVLLNLLANAKDAVNLMTYNEGLHPTISLSVTSANDLLIISVTDNGCGICNEEIENIFEPFITHKENGTGLGLAIAMRIAKAHNGNLTVTSVPGVHTTFVLTLPV